MTPEQQAIIDKVRKRREAGGGASPPSSMSDEQQQAIEAARVRRAAREIPGVKTLKTKPAKDQTQFTLPMQEAMRMGPLVASQMMQAGQPLTGLPPDQNLAADGPQAPNLTEQQQRLAEFARIARAPAGGPNIEAGKSQIGPSPSDPYEDEKLAGRAIWQLKNKGGTYDPNYQMSAGETAADLYNSLDSGFGQGVATIGGLPGTIQKAVPGINEWINNRLGWSPEDIAAARAADEKRLAGQYKLPDIDQMTSGMERMKPGSMDYRPATAGGGYTHTAGQFLGSAGPGGRTAGAIARNLLVPAIATRAAEEYTGGNQGAALAAGLAAPLALKGLTSGLGRVISPFATQDAARAAAANVLRREGVRMTAGDITGSKMLKAAESELGGGAYNNLREGQLEDLTEAALRRVGSNARRADPAELDRIQAAIGQQFRNLGQRNVVSPDTRFGHELGNVWRRYVAHTNPASHNRVQAVEDYVREIVTASRSANADVYQSLRSRLARDARGAADPELRRAYNGLRNAVDDVMERSIARTNPADLGAFRTARRQHRNFLAIEDAMTGASTETGLGLITPPMLSKGVRVKHGKTSVARQRGDLSELARASQSLLRDLPSSETARRAAVRYGPRMVGAGIGATAGAALFGAPVDPQSAVAGAASAGLGALAPYLIGRGILSGPGRALLTNRLGLGLRQTGGHLGGWRMPSLLAAGGAGVYALTPSEKARQEEHRR